MQITRQASYAARAILHLARSGKNAPISSSKVAKAEKIPPSFLGKIMWQLSMAGIVHTSRGAGGGVKLARAPKNITLLEVIEAVDGPIRLNECVEANGICSFEENCPMRLVWCEAQHDLVAKLKKANFAQLSA